MGPGEDRLAAIARTILILNPRPSGVEPFMSARARAIWEAPVPRAPNAVWEALFITTRGILGQLRQNLRRRGLTVSQFWVLRCLRDHGTIPMGKLSQWLDVTFPTVTGLVDHLESLGFVARRAPPGDRRVVLVELTPGGSDAIQGLEGEMTSFVDGLVELIPPEDRPAVARTLTRLARDLTPAHGDCSACAGALDSV